MDPLDDLLQQLCSGDNASAERVFLAYEPYLRMVVRRMIPMQLRPKFDSIDVVQSVWADVLTGFRDSGWQFESAAHLKGFLIKATRNRFIDRLRQQRLPLAHERSMETIDPEDYPVEETSPSENAQADELWAQMLELCPPQHRPLLELKKQGLSLDEIAARTGLHPSSVRRVLYDLARRLATSAGDEETPVSE